MTGEQLTVLMSPAIGGTGGNPYIDQLVTSVEACGAVVEDFTRRALLDAPDVVHVHWPMHLIRPRPSPGAVLDAAKVLGLIALARARGSALVWTAHDLEPHEGFPSRLHSAFHALFLQQVDRLVVLSEQGASTLLARWPVLRGIPMTRVPLGHYRDWYPPALAKDEARAALGIPGGATVHLTLGQVKRYKNLVELAGVWGEGAGPGEELHVVGEVWDHGLDEELARAAEADPRIHLHLGRASDAEVSLWHSAADAVVLVYAQGTPLNSSAAMLALSFGLPVVVRRSPTMQELADVVGDDWLLQCDGPADGLAALRHRLRHPPSSAAPAGMEQYEWSAIGAGTLAAYRAALRSPRWPALPRRRALLRGRAGDA